MNDGRKTYRTDAYCVAKDGQDHIVFWCLMPSGLDPDKYWVTEYDIQGIVVVSKPVAEQMPEREALRRIAEIDREAAAMYPVADNDVLLKHPYVDKRTHEAPSWQQHLMRDEEKQAALQRLRAKRPPGLKFKL